MTKQGFFTTFSSGNPLLFYGTEELPEGEWFVYVNYVIFARPDDGVGKKAMDYVAGNETGVTREEGEEGGAEGKKKGEEEGQESRKKEE